MSDGYNFHLLFFNFQGCCASGDRSNEKAKYRLSNMSGENGVDNLAYENGKGYK